MIIRAINNTKLRRKLFIAFFTFTCIIILVSGMSFWFYGKRDNMQDITIQIEDITTDVLKLVKHEADFFEDELQGDEFFRTGKSISLKKNRELMQDIQKRIQKLLQKEEIKNFAVDSKLKQLSFELNEYSNKLSKVVDTYFKKGKTETGIEGKMREYVHKLEKQEILPKVLILNLRRYEKDYLMRKDSISIALFQQNIKLARQQLTKTDDLDLLEKYEQAFQQYVTYDKILGNQYRKQNKLGLKEQIKGHSETAIQLIEQTSKIVNDRSKAMRGEFQNIFVITLLIVIVLSLTFSYFLSFFMTIPVTELSRSMQKAIEMNFSEDLKPARKYTNDEIGILTDEFNLMIKRIQEQFRQIKENAHLLQESNENLQSTNLQLAESEKRLSKFLLVKETLFGIITQDLKSPLNSLKGFLSLMQHHPDTFSPEELQGVAGDMYASFDKITLLMNSLVQWSQTQTGDLAYNPNHFNITAMTEQVVTFYSQMAKGKNIKVSNLLPEELIVNADKDMINFTLRNLVSNAIKFTHEGGSVDIVAKNRDKNMVMVTIKDTGVGMSEELMEKIFMPEVHISMLGTNNEKGSGFGLMMCKDFVQKNEGKIYIESEEGKGTSVHFTLKKVV
jgi:signal transduction histidine kinase